MAKIGKTKRFQILARDGFRCRYCGASADIAKLEIDHRLAIAAGGDNNDENLITACSDCNRGKSDGVLIPIVGGFEVDQSAQRQRTKKLAASLTADVSPNKHWLTSEILDVGDQADGVTLVLLRCETHSRLEWHWIDDYMCQTIGTWGAEAGWIHGKAQAAA